MILVPYSHEFAQHIFAWINNKAYNRFFRGMRALSLDEIKNYPQCLGVIVFIILIGDKVAGMIQVAEERALSRIVRVGVLVDESFQKQGIGLKATVKIADYLFNSLDLRKLHFYVCQDDQRIIELLTKGGLRKEATLKGTAYINGQYMDEVLFTIFKDHFNQLYKR